MGRVQDITKFSALLRLGNHDGGPGDKSVADKFEAMAEKTESPEAHRCSKKWLKRPPVFQKLPAFEKTTEKAVPNKRRWPRWWSGSPPMPQNTKKMAQKDNSGREYGRERGRERGKEDG